MVDGVKGDGHGILALGLTIDGNLDLLGDGFQLLDGSGTIDVAGNQQRFAFFLAVLEAVGEFAGESGFTGTLQTRHQDDGGIALDAEGGFFAAHEFGQLVVDDLDHQLAGVNGVDHVLAHSFGLDVIDEFLGDGVADIGVNQRSAHFFQGGCYIDFGDAALSFQDLE